jgi:hypothetical protein
LRKCNCGEDSNILRIVGVASDVTERRQTELALATERSHLTTLMENLPFYIYFKESIAASSQLAGPWPRFTAERDPGELIDSKLVSSEHAEHALVNELEIIRTRKRFHVGDIFPWTGFSLHRFPKYSFSPPPRCRKDTEAINQRYRRAFTLFVRKTKWSRVRRCTIPRV